MQLETPHPESIGLIRFEAERELYNELLSDKVIAPVAEKLWKNNADDSHRRGLLASALRITDRILPVLAERVDRAQRIANLQTSKVETFIYNDPKHAASCLCFENGLFLLISSGLYTSLSETELMFVIGHEFGHAVYKHYLLPTRALLARKGVCDAENALKLMAWSRRAEISADRVGLLCCQDLDAAATAFIKLSSGLNKELVGFDLMGYVSQVMDLEAVSRSVRAVDDLYSTHPFNPMRIAALYRFRQSDTFCKLLECDPLGIGPAPGRQSDKDADARIHELLQYMDPDVATMGTRNAVECLVWGGLWIAASRGQITQPFFQSIAKAVNSPITSEAFAFVQKHADPLKLIQERFDRAAVGCRRLPPAERHAIVQQMIATAKANVDVATEEKTTLQKICIALELNPGFAERILGQYAQQTQSVDTIFSQMF